MSGQRHRVLGRLQQAILSLLWNREMYGMEIQRRLRFQGIKVSAGQLYPALKRMEERQWVISREERRVGADRVYYTISSEGKETLVHNTLDLIRFFESIIDEAVYPIYSKAAKRLGIGPGTVIIDFSNPSVESLRTELSALTAPGGRYYISSRDKEQMNILKEWVEYEKLHDTITILEESGYTVALPDKSVDVALVIFTLHEDDTEWILSEINRVLKPSGRCLIVDIEAREKDHFREVFYAQVMPGHSRSGIDMDVLLPMLEEKNLKITEEHYEKGLIMLRAQPQTET
jgi:DNA-binding PadR family transcriptional regulator